MTCGALRRAPPRRTRRIPPLPTCTAPPRVHTPPWPRPRARARRWGNAARAAASAHGPAESLAPPCSFLIQFPYQVRVQKVSSVCVESPDSRCAHFWGWGQVFLVFLAASIAIDAGPKPQTDPSRAPPGHPETGLGGRLFSQDRKKRSINDISSGLSGMPLPSQVTFGRTGIVPGRAGAAPGSRPVARAHVERSKRMRLGPGPRMRDTHTTCSVILHFCTC